MEFPGSHIITQLAVFISGIFPAHLGDYNITYIPPTKGTPEKNQLFPAISHGFPGWFPRLPRLMKYEKNKFNHPEKIITVFLGVIYLRFFSVTCCFFWYWKKQGVLFIYIYSPGILPKTCQSSFYFNRSSWGTWVIFSVFDEHSYIQKQHTTSLVHPFDDSMFQKGKSTTASGCRKRDPSGVVYI